jgi:hypothetical protein
MLMFPSTGAPFFCDAVSRLLPQLGGFEGFCVADDKIPGRCAETFVRTQVQALRADSPRK